MHVGILGFGKMGRAIAERLIESGHQITAWNRTSSKIDAVNNVTAVASPTALASQCEIILSILANDTATEVAYHGDDGLCTGGLAGNTIIEMCTMSPERVEALADAVKAKGGAFVECPVGGTVKPARDGALLGMAAGEKADYDRVRPLLEQLTRRVDYLGAVGNGAAMKLAINLPLMVYWGALGEAVGLLGNRGIPDEQAFDILTDSSGAIGPAKMRQAPIIELLKTGTSGVSNFAIDQALKDMSLMVALARTEAIDSPIINAAQTTAQESADGGWGSKDISLLAAWRKHKAS
ncbi:NAD(P)-dependent oxidoreductase [Alphaproteobacteria bacterium LSUCC0226]